MRVNPVLLKEMKVRMRTWRIVGMISFYLAVMCLVACLCLNSINNNSSSIANSNLVSGLYVGIGAIQYGLILLIVPALTAGVISGERERQTLDLLICTRMSPLSIIIGKLFSSLSQVVLLVVASLPVFSVILFFGGISILQILALFSFFIVVAIMAGCVGIFFSTYFKKTTVATVLTYAVGAAMMFGTFLVAAFYYSIVSPNNSMDHMPAILYINPLVGFAGVISDQVGDGAGMLFRFSATDKASTYWQINVAFNIILSFVLIFLSARKLNPARKSTRGMGK